MMTLFYKKFYYFNIFFYYLGKTKDLKLKNFNKKK